MHKEDDPKIVLVASGFAKSWLHVLAISWWLSTSFTFLTTNSVCGVPTPGLKVSKAHYKPVISTQTETQCEEDEQAADILEQMEGATSDDTIHTNDATEDTIQIVHIPGGHSV